MVRIVAGCILIIVVLVFGLDSCSIYEFGVLMRPLSGQRASFIDFRLKPRAPHIPPLLPLTPLRVQRPGTA